jgi:hypothetical protein
MRGEVEKERGKMGKYAKRRERTGINAVERDKTGKNATCKRLKPQTKKATQDTMRQNSPENHLLHTFL